MDPTLIVFAEALGRYDDIWIPRCVSHTHLPSPDASPFCPLPGPPAQPGFRIVLGVGTNAGALTAGTRFFLHSYVIVGRLHDVEASLVELYSVNPLL